jgi:pimeloyl-ACP methyl ester carboxylesterase
MTDEDIAARGADRHRATEGAMRGLRTLVAIAAFALLAGCTNSPTHTAGIATPSEDRSFALGAEAMQRCTSGGFPAACGGLEVPEDRSDPTGRMIRLNVVVIPAVSEHPAADPVFFLAGGPGGAATENWAYAAQTFPAIHRDRDIVLVDQRGTGGSNELVFPPPPDISGLSRSEGWRRVKRWANGAIEGLDGDLRYYTSAIAADDLDDVRTALGYDLIDLYGSSYGATLAQYYLRQHEAHVRAVVLDSGTLLDVPILEVMAARSQEALERVFARCDADPGCHASYPDPARDLREAFRLLSHPVKTDAVDYGSGEHVILTSDSLAGRVHDLLATGRSGEIPRLLHATAAEDFQPLTSLVLAALQEPDPGQVAMFWSIECSEAWASHDRRRIAGSGAGSYYASVMQDAGREIDLGCSLMPRIATRADDGHPVRSNVPVLLLNGTLDPQDPPANVADAAVELPNSLVIVAPQAHTFGHIGCMPDVVAAFIATGTVEGLDTTCVDGLPMPPFTTSAG